MQRTSMVRANPEIERMVKDLLAADASFDRHEARSVHRDQLVRHLRLEFSETGQRLEAFSRNISTAGIGVITSQAIPSGVIAVMEIVRLKGASAKIIAECRWCKSYGENWFISGWQFRSIKR